MAEQVAKLGRHIGRALVRGLGPFRALKTGPRRGSTTLDLEWS